MKNFIKKNIAPITFFIFGVIGLAFISVSMNFIARELSLRFIRNAIMAMALIIPIWAGMGLNFSIVVGAMSTQAAMIIGMDIGLNGEIGLIVIILMAIVLSLICGYLVGKILNKAHGKEMIVSIVIGFLATNIYQLIFMVGYGTFIPVKNSEILLSRGVGVRNMVDISQLKEVFMSNRFAHLLVILLVAFIIFYIGRSKLGNQMRVTRDNIAKAKYLGIDTDRIRLIAILLSTVLAAIGHCMFVLEMGNINVYTGHMNIDVFASAALLAGGATLFNASVVNALVGTVLFHFVFLISPLFGKAIFNDVAIGEYFRSFIAYGTLVMVFILNITLEKPQ